MAGKEGGDQQAVAQATAAAQAAAVPVEAAGKHELNMLCDNRPHQALIHDVFLLPALTALSAFKSSLGPQDAVQHAAPPGNPLLLSRCPPWL